MIDGLFGTDKYEFVHAVPLTFLEPVFVMLGVEGFENSLETIKQFGGNNLERLADVLEPTLRQVWY